MQNPLLSPDVQSRLTILRNRALTWGRDDSVEDKVSPAEMDWSLKESLDLLTAVDGLIGINPGTAVSPQRQGLTRCLGNFPRRKPDLRAYARSNAWFGDPEKVYDLWFQFGSGDFALLDLPEAFLPTELRSRLTRLQDKVLVLGRSSSEETRATRADRD